GPIYQVGAHFMLERVVAPVEQMLEDQQTEDDLDRRFWTPPAAGSVATVASPWATVSITASSSSSVSIRRNQSDHSLWPSGSNTLNRLRWLVESHGAPQDQHRRQRINTTDTAQPSEPAPNRVLVRRFASVVHSTPA